VPDIKPDSKPGEFGAFIMNPEGVGRLFAPSLNDGPFPEHYESVEAPVDNVLHPKVTSSPVSKRFSSDKDVYGKKEDFPIVCTTYRLTEHYHYWTSTRRFSPSCSRDSSSRSPTCSPSRRHRKRVEGEGHLGARVDRGRRDGHETAAPMKIDGKELCRSASRSTGFCRHPLPHRAARKLPDAERHGPQHVDPEFKTFLVKLEKA